MIYWFFIIINYENEICFEREWFDSDEGNIVLNDLSIEECHSYKRYNKYKALINKNNDKKSIYHLIRDEKNKE
jgi:hypothetical protein